MKILKVFNSTISLSFRHYKKLKFNTRKCAMAFINKDGPPSGLACRAYCNNFSINQTSPVVEGFKVFFDDVIHNLEKFFDDQNIKF